MKKIYAFFIALMVAQVSLAQWPANYGGVMLQAFYWDSYEDTQWSKFTSEADSISNYFDLLWIPNSANCRQGQSMGYMPVYWFDQRSSFGRENALRTMIRTFKEKGTKVIEDVVLNHRAPLGQKGSWTDLANEKWTFNDQTIEINWTPADICKNDDGGHTANMAAEMGFEAPTGGYDTGDDFSGGRDLDHTSANTQKNCKTYLDYLIRDLGYAGFRLDMVKGYAGEYNKMYNEYAKPEFCVGEYWDGNQDAVTGWINSTGQTSAAFDFPLKYVLRDAFGGGDWSKLGYRGMAGDPYWCRFSVTFVDNHDTYENQDRLVNNVLAANAYILALPGTPCIFLKHWQRYPIAIGNMIKARKACGITNQSSIVGGESLQGGYVTKVQGTKGTVMCISGFPQVDTSGFKLIASGTNFAYFVSDNITVEGLVEGSDAGNTTKKDIDIYVEATEAPYLYAWVDGGRQLTAEWPGDQMERQTEVNGHTFWKRTFNEIPVNVIFNDGGNPAKQTADISGLIHDSYFTYDGATGFTDITDEFYQLNSEDLPACVKPIDGHLYVYFLGNKDYTEPYIWVWGEGGKSFNKNTTWPGDALEQVGDDGDGHAVYAWDGGELTEGDQPTNLLFSNKGDDTFKTKDLIFHNGGYYDVAGYWGAIPSGISRITVDTPATKAAIYSLTGQRVGSNYRGIVVSEGRKHIAR